MPEQTSALLYRIMSTEQQKQLEVSRQLDFSYGVPGLGRFRVNVHFQRDSLAAAFRHIPEELRTLEELGLPPSPRGLAMKPRGLVLVTGPTGSGKSTTLASLIDEVNRTKPHHILTIEDPIEVVHRHKRCVVTQREIGADAPSFSDALRAALRQDPDVILPGERPDLQTNGTLPASTSRTRSREASRRRCSQPLTAWAASPASRSSSPTTRCGTSSARGRAGRLTRPCRTPRRRGG